MERCDIAQRQDDGMEFLYGLGFLALFGLSAIAGVWLRVHLTERHLSKDDLEAVRLVTGLLVTFAALILSLQLSTERSAFDVANKDRLLYAAHLTRFDQCLRNLGPQMKPARLLLQQYTAAVIASTWPDEPKPFVEGMPDASRMAVRGEDPGLTVLMNEIGLAIDTVAPPDARSTNIAVRCRLDFGSVQQNRWSVIEDTNSPNSGIFVAIISFWLALVFVSFGLQIPRRPVPSIVLALGVISVASVMFVILDLGRPYGGVFGITSAAMRGALADMKR